jgi:hypothetical protein
MKIDDIFKYALGALVIIGFFILIVILTLRNNEEILNLCIGALIGSFTTIVGYYYGSSIGSKMKTDLMARQNEKNEVVEQNING